MSRYIEADVLKNKLQQHHDFFVNAWGGFMGMPIQDKARCDELSNSIAEIFNAPSIDLVRCVECKHFGEDSVGTYCDRYKCTMMPDGFCSYGCRKESEE